MRYPWAPVLTCVMLGTQSAWLLIGPFPLLLWWEAAIYSLGGIAVFVGGLAGIGAMERAERPAPPPARKETPHA